jgi:rubrerythrin
MTNEELIAQARKLCEKRVAEYKVTLEFYEEKSGAGYEWTLAQYNSWTTHLAEMDEHEKNRFIDPTSYGEKWICKVCGKDCPCDFLITKAKRLLGVE